MSELDNIVTIKVHPSIGIARVGNAPDELYYAPEVPGELPNPGSSFRDSKGRIKRQACRFRIYGYDASGQVVRELTADDGDITWRVEVANLKAGWYAFVNAMDLPSGMAIAEARRNPQYRGDARNQLDIVPGSRSISGRNVSGAQYTFDTGKFFESKVYLGEVRTDEAGRLIFVPGRGKSSPKVTGTKPTTFANNDDWHDDVADGPVRARVELPNGRSLEAEPGYVVVTPPDFGPGLQGPVTMADVVKNTFIELGWQETPTRPSFAREIWPIFSNLATSQWANNGVNMMVGHNAPADPHNPQVYAQLASNDDAHAAYRQRWFQLFRNPRASVQEPVAIPPFYGSAFGEFDDAPEAYLSITAAQYDTLEKWASGQFDADAPTQSDLPPVPAFAELSASEQCAALDRVGLSNCLGDAFHPGIELTWIMRRGSMWKAPYRLNVLPEGERPRQDYGDMLEPAVALGPDGPLDASGPGALTRYMGVPWQTDEASCASGYNPHFYTSMPSFWAPRVPNQVLSEDSYARLMDDQLPIGQRLKHFDFRQDWYRDIQGRGYQDRIANMVEQWWMLGIVRQQPGPSDEPLLPSVLFVEDLRCERLTGNAVDEGCRGIRYEFFDPNFKLIVEMEDLNDPTKCEQIAALDAPARSILRMSPKQQEQHGEGKDPTAPSPLRGSFRRDQR